MHISRTRFGRDIVCEFLPPIGRTPRKDKALILCQGMPSVPGKKAEMEYWAKKGYWVFFPRYKGSWESGGRFLARSPHLDVKEVVDGLSKGFKDLWTGKSIRIRPAKIHLVCSSFGGPAGILLSNDKRVDKIVALCPVIDWTDQESTEPLGPLEKITREAYGEGYRFSRKDWKRLSSGTFYNPIAHMKSIDGSKVMIVHSRDDTIVPIAPAMTFRDFTGCKLHVVKTGGHLGLQGAHIPTTEKQVLKFLRS